LGEEPWKEYERARMTTTSAAQSFINVGERTNVATPGASSRRRPGPVQACRYVRNLKLGQAPACAGVTEFGRGAVERI